MPAPAIIALRLGDLVNGLGTLGKNTWGVAVSWHFCQGTQCSQTHPIGPSHAKSRVIFLMYHPCSLPEMPEQQVHLKDFDHYLMRIMVEVLNILQLSQRDSNKVEPEPVGVCRIKIFSRID